jgi:hypothetical protein
VSVRDKLGFWLGLAGLLAALGGCASSQGEAVAVTPTQAPFPYVELGNIDRVFFNEPSGVVFCPGRNSLFLVGDEGDLAEIEPDGTLVKQAWLGDVDLEGVTVVPPSGPVYVAVEGQETILEVDPDTFEVLRQFPVERDFEGQTLLPPGGDGLEAITFVPDSDHPQGGTFYLANQGGGKEVALIVEVEVPLSGAPARGRSAQIVRYVSLGVMFLWESAICRGSITMGPAAASMSSATGRTVFGKSVWQEKCWGSGPCLARIKRGSHWTQRGFCISPRTRVACSSLNTNEPLDTNGL